MGPLIRHSNHDQVSLVPAVPQVVGDLAKCDLTCLRSTNANKIKNMYTRMPLERKTTSSNCCAFIGQKMGRYLGLHLFIVGGNNYALIPPPDDEARCSLHTFM